MGGMFVKDRGLGIAGEIWNTVTGSRAKDTVYQNTTGKPVAVFVKATIDSSSEGRLEVGPSNPPTIGQGSHYENTVSSTGTGFFAIVPPGWYYQLKTVAGTLTMNTWAELY